MKKITLDNRYRSVPHRFDSSVELQMKLIFCSGFLGFLCTNLVLMMDQEVS